VPKILFTNLNTKKDSQRAVLLMNNNITIMFVLFLQNTHTFYGNVTKLLCAGKLNTGA